MEGVDPESVELDVGAKEVTAESIEVAATAKDIAGD